MRCGISRAAVPLSFALALSAAAPNAVTAAATDPAEWLQARQPAKSGGIRQSVSGDSASAVRDNSGIRRRDSSGLLVRILATVLRVWRPRLIVLQPTPYCNINCAYCYLGHRDDRRLMAPAVIDAIRDRLFARMAPDASPRIVWHAGEPTVAPIAWYEFRLPETAAGYPARGDLRRSNQRYRDIRGLDRVLAAQQHQRWNIDRRATALS